MAFTLVDTAIASGLAGGTSSAVDMTGVKLFIGVLVCDASSSGQGVSDSEGNTWTPLTEAYVSESPRVRFYYVIAPAVDAAQTFTANSNCVAGVFIVAGFSAAGTVTFDTQNGSAASTDVTSKQPGSITPGDDNQVVVTGLGLGGAVTSLAIDGSYSIADQLAFSGGVNYGAAIAYIVQGTAAATNPTWSWTTAVFAGAVIATFADSGAAALTSGEASFTSATNTTINLSCGAASGGTSPYTYQWYRSTTSNFTPGGGNLLSGATSLTLNDSASLSANTPYYYICRATDDVSATVDSNQVAGILFAAPVKVGGIGDSIMNGYGLSAGQDPLTRFGEYIAKMYTQKTVTVYNEAIDGADTADWLAGTTLADALTVFTTAGATHVIVMLGANDAAAGTLRTAADFKTNLGDICTDIIAEGLIPILCYPTYIPAGANSGATTAESVALTQAYQPKIDELINGTTILRGDTLGFAYFMDHLSEYQSDDTHPTATGAQSLGLLWARAFDRYVMQIGGGVMNNPGMAGGMQRT